MKSGIIGILLFASIAASAATDPNKNFGCQAKINGAAMDMFAGMDPDGSAFYISPDGKTQVTDPNRVVSRETQGDVETIVYKTKEPRYSADGKMVMEVVKHTIQITRQNGKITSVNKLWDVNKQAAARDSFAKSCPNCMANQMPLVKSMESTFTYDGDNCSVNQDVTYQMKDANSQAEAKVTYDKKFCDSLGPILKQMGAQNAAQCANLFAMAQASFESREKELKAEKKSFQNGYFGIYSGTNPGKVNADANFDLGSKIAMCSMADGWGMGMYGGIGMPGMGLMMGSAYGMPMGGGIMGGAPTSGRPSSRTTTNPAVK
ncbi:MAG TPA: hypothetical protein VF412_15685 [Bdellovibrio sp.]|uniref:hypothetical protein n=1 Tax=Bdellovibrio sp. TaxID=28201 RepID=UPI002F0339F5